MSAWPRHELRQIAETEGVRADDRGYQRPNRRGVSGQVPGQPLPRADDQHADAFGDGEGRAASYHGGLRAPGTQHSTEEDCADGQRRQPFRST
jgi:hypothetical protein